MDPVARLLGALLALDLDWTRQYYWARAHRHPILWEHAAEDLRVGVRTSARTDDAMIFLEP